MRILGFAVLITAGIVAMGQAETRKVDFTQDGLDQPPKSFEFGHTAGVGKPGTWVVQSDGTNKVLAQADADSTRSRFPVAVLSDVTAADVDLSVRFKPISGRVDQAAGLVWRYQNQDNYYIVRANALEDNVVLYKVEGGKRTDLPLKGEGRTYGKNSEVPSGQWSTLREALVDPEGFWTGFSARMRVIAYNTNAVKPNDAPQSIFELADPKWKGQVAMADPRFGSTSFHVAALYALAGDEKMDDFFRRLKANGVRIVDGNSVVRDLVARGDAQVGLTDTDDVNVAVDNGEPIAMVLPDRNGLGVPVMPNMVSLIANAPHGEEARTLIDYLLSADVERQLAQSEAVQIPLHAGVPGPNNIPAIDTFTPMTLDYAKAASRVEDVTARLATILGL